MEWFNKTFKKNLDKNELQKIVDAMPEPKPRPANPGLEEPGVWGTLFSAILIGSAITSQR